MSDYRAGMWKRDADSFARWVAVFRTLHHSTAKGMVLRHLQGIQSRWPQFIKESELPVLSTSDGEG